MQMKTVIENEFFSGLITAGGRRVARRICKIDISVSVKVSINQNSLRENSAFRNVGFFVFANLAGLKMPGCEC